VVPIDALAEHILAFNNVTEFKNEVLPNLDPLDYVDRLHKFSLTAKEWLNTENPKESYSGQIEDITNILAQCLFRLKRVYDGYKDIQVIDGLKKFSSDMSIELKPSIEIIKDVVRIANGSSTGLKDLNETFCDDDAFNEDKIIKWLRKRYLRVRFYSETKSFGKVKDHVFLIIEDYLLKSPKNSLGAKIESTRSINIELFCEIEEHLWNIVLGDELEKLTDERVEKELPEELLKKLKDTKSFSIKEFDGESTGKYIDFLEEIRQVMARYPKLDLNTMRNAIDEYSYKSVFKRSGKSFSTKDFSVKDEIHNLLDNSWDSTDRKIQSKSHYSELLKKVKDEDELFHIIKEYYHGLPSEIEFKGKKINLQTEFLKDIEYPEKLSKYFSFGQSVRNLKDRITEYTAKSLAELAYASLDKDEIKKGFKGYNGHSTEELVMYLMHKGYKLQDALSVYFNLLNIPLHSGNKHFSETDKEFDASGDGASYISSLDTGGEEGDQAIFSSDDWIQNVKTNAVDIPEGTFTKSGEEIAKTLEDPKVSPKGIGSAVKMAVFYKNRAGKNLDPERKIEIDKAIKILENK
jgi:hypothetical protein